MEYGMKDIFDLYIYDEEENLITKFNTAKENLLNIYSVGEIRKAEMILKSELLNLDLLKFMETVTNENLTEFQKKISNNKDNKISFKSKETYKKCKIIAEGVFRDLTGLDSICKLIFNKAKLSKTYNIKANFNCPSDFNLLIDFEPDDSDNLFEMYL